MPSFSASPGHAQMTSTKTAVKKKRPMGQGQDQGAKKENAKYIVRCVVCEQTRPGPTMRFSLSLTIAYPTKPEPALARQVSFFFFFLPRPVLSLQNSIFYTCINQFPRTCVRTCPTESIRHNSCPTLLCPSISWMSLGCQILLLFELTLSKLPTDQLCPVCLDG